MQTSRRCLAIVTCFLACTLCYAEGYKLPELAAKQRLELHNRSLRVAPKEMPEAIYLTPAAGDGVAWIDGLEFSEGSIEIEALGADRPGQSFIGLAFHGQNNTTYDAVYLRPFNFRNASRRQHALQYVSLPDSDWSALRKAFPGRYESSLDPAPAPDSWIRLKLVVMGDRLAVHIDDQDAPALETTLLNTRLRGRVGLWVGNGSDGYFRNLHVVHR